MKKIKIPHIGYTIFVRDKAKLKGYENSVANTVKNNENSCTIYIHLPLKERDLGTLSHEVMHAIQFLSNSRGIDMISEMEHTGYLMQYIFNEVRGFKYVV